MKCALFLKLFLYPITFALATCGVAKDRTFEAALPAKPNIIWFVFEDMSPIIPPYGDNTIETPTISRLAAEGVKYTNVYSPSGVCSPSRAALALGMYPSAIGANHMRTTSHTQVTGLPKYEAVPPAEARMLSQYLQEQGYYTTNNFKTDYQFKAPKSAWNESSAVAHWRNRPQDKPFFSVFNFTTTHESGLFEPYGVRKIESRHYFADNAERISTLPQHHSVKTTGAETPIHIPEDIAFNVPPYLPDTPLVRRDMWKMYNNLAEADKQMGAIIQQLKDDGLYDNSIIFFYSDHGGPLPRQKRLIYDSGLKVPLIIKYANSYKAGTTDDQLVSFVDFAPATLALAGTEKPVHMHGRDFILESEPKRNYIHAAGDRFDGFTDVIRAVKDNRYKYIRNYRPKQPYYLPVAYREKIPTMQELLRLQHENKLDKNQAQWFRSQKPNEELFDTLVDPYELNNLALDPEYKHIVSRLSVEMDRWLTDISDSPKLSEADLIDRLWQRKKHQPVTDAAEINYLKIKSLQTKNQQAKHPQKTVSISSATEGAAISYKLIKNQIEPDSWSMYHGPFTVDSSVSSRVEIIAVAHRIGYAESRVSKRKLIND